MHTVHVDGAIIRLCRQGACFVLGAWCARNGLTGWAWFSRITGLVFDGSLRIGRCRNDFGVHRSGCAGVDVVGGGVGQALPVVGLVDADVNVDDHAVVIAGPNPIDRLVENHDGGTHLAVGSAVLMP